jgi:hypothetical protein
MKKYLSEFSLYTILTLISCFLLLTAIPVVAQVDSISKSLQLKEVVVKGKNIQQTADHFNCIPTDKQRRHSHSGFDLVRKMMIPGINVDMENGTIDTPAGGATLYINGREATYREVQSLRPVDIIRIEYYDMPTGKYAKDRAVINYIIKNYTSGGYTQIDGLQGVGYKEGNYNLASKYSFGNDNVNVWAGYRSENPKEDLYTSENYALPENIVKTVSSVGNDKDHVEKYLTASLSHMTPKNTWMVRASIEANRQWNNILGGNTQYLENQDTTILDSRQYSRESSVKPTLYVYFNRNINKNQNLDAVLDSYYARNQYLRDYHEDGRFISDVDEGYFYSKLNANYNVSLPKKNNLTFSFHEYLRISQDDYNGTPEYWQHLRSSETIFFADYNKRWNHAMIDINPGVSYLAYKLHGDNAVKHLSPRLQLSSSWMPDKLQRIRLFFSLGNTFPTLSTLSRVDQQIDRVMIRRGNPSMDNSTLLGPAFTYLINYKQWSAFLSCYYTYMSNAIVNRYSVEGRNIINSFSSDAQSHLTSASLSVTWKPSNNFNVKMDGNFTNAIVDRAIRERQNGWQMGLQANYYVGDFSFSASCNSFVKSLEDYQFHVRKPWQYSLSTEWSHDNIAVILETRNLFAQNNIQERSLTSDVYTLSQQLRRECDNSYASVKFICSVDYGKKVRHSPQYDIKEAESTILK